MKKKNGVLTEVTDEDLQLLSLNPNKFWKDVKEIGNGAFKDCWFFEITIPKDIKLNWFAFSNSKVVKATVLCNELSYNCFSKCKHLTEVKLNSEIKEIPSYCFSHSGLKEIELPDSIEFISGYAFEKTGLKDIKIPHNVNTICDSAFYGCKKLQTVELPNNTNLILRKGVFQDCENLINVSNIENVSRIPQNAFLKCEKLKQINLKSATTISENAFMSCSRLADVKFSEDLENIFNCAFKNSGIQHVDLKNTNLSHIGYSAFENCENLLSVSLSDEIRFIPGNAFFYCKNLKDVQLGEKVKEIKYNAFGSCSSLKSIALPESVQVLEVQAFKNCGLENISIPEKSKLAYIGDECFKNCFKLKFPQDMPPNLTGIGNNAFKDCLNIQSLNLTNSFITDGFVGNNSLLEYICFVNNQFISSVSAIGNDWVKVGQNSTLALELIKNWDNNEIKQIVNGFNKTKLDSLNELQNSFKGLPISINLLLNWKDRYNQLLDYIKPEAVKLVFMLDQNMQAILNNLEKLNFKWHHTFINSNIVQTQISKLNKAERYNLCKLFYNLGGMKRLVKTSSVSKSGNEKVVITDYGQKVSEFLTNMLNKNLTSLTALAKLSEHMELKGFNKQFTDFLIENKGANFNQLLKLEKDLPSFISHCYNNFEQIQLSNTSDKGSQRQLKPTVKHFVNNFLKLEGVTKNNAEIAKYIKNYLSGSEVQSSFTKARIINAERNGVKFNAKFEKLEMLEKYKILDEIEKGNICESEFYKVKEPINNILKLNIDQNIYNKLNKLDETISECENISAQILSNATDIANNNFSFQWLDKSHPVNFVLGKLCNCCAHLQNTGYGVMRASIIHPDIQNLVIRNADDVIIAKSTLYVNREQGYAVFNNVEVANETKVYESEYEKIYFRFMQGAKAFVEQYNKENAIPLKVVTVGMDNNDLEDIILECNKKSKTLYKAINFAKYSNLKNAHSGDSFNCQYIIYEKEKDKEF